MSSYFVVPLSPSYIPQVDKLMSDIFGAFDKRQETITRWSTDFRLNPLVLIHNERVIGAATIYVDIKPNLKKLAPFNLDMEKVFDFEKPIAQVLDLCIHPDYRRLGLGKMLIQRQLNFLKIRNCNQFAGVSWVNGSAANSEHFFKHHKFTALATAKIKLVNQNSGVDDYPCTLCGKDCNCDAIFFAKSPKLESSDLRQTNLCL